MACLSGAIVACLSGGLAGCSSGGSGAGAPAGTTQGAAAASASAAAQASANNPSPSRPGPSTPREGQAITRSAGGDALYVAQQDLSALHVLPLPLDASRPPLRVALPGRPSQIVVVDAERVLVTVRDPGLVLVMRPDAAAGLVETARIPVAADAFGIALTPDRARALVTSAWTHTVSAVDLAANKVVFSLDVPREPRGVVVSPDGKRAYVTHLTLPELTRMDDLNGAGRVTKVPFAVAPLRSREAAPEAATLAYTGVLSPDGARLFVPRRALSGDGKRPWAGQPVVDVLLTGDDSSLAQPPTGRLPGYTTKELEEARTFGTGRGPFADLTFGGGFPIASEAFIQPRAAVYRSSTRTLLVASEGTDAVVELDALAIEPGAHVLRRHPLRGRTWSPKAGLERALVIGRVDGSLYRIETEDGQGPLARDETGLLNNASSGILIGIERRKSPPAEMVIRQVMPDDSPGETMCGAPTGLALSVDERTAWVLCRTTLGVAEISLEPDKDLARAQRISPRVLKLEDDPLPAEAALGRRLYFNASDGTLSGGFACAGCHPEGRDDGHVWQELTDSQDEERNDPKSEPCATYLATPTLPFFFPFVGTNFVGTPMQYGYTRQTPMLAGRLAAKGPFGWKGRSPDLPSRVMRGSSLHGWNLPEQFCGASNMKARALALAAFARAGLFNPPRDERPLTAEEERGKAVFADSKTGCQTCHVPATGYTDRSVVPFAESPLVFEKSGPVKRYEPEKDRMFKTPSLLFVGGTAPYFHDGTAATLEELIDKNRDRMGKTSHLSADDKKALAAFLRTL
ncbi:MAG: hypothetical protein R3B70_11240 [Polyangiaceae bacterium]